MQQTTAILLEHETHGGWITATLGAPSLTTAQPGQYVALRCAALGSHDPLLRQPLFVVRADARARTIELLVPLAHPAATFLQSVGRGAQLDLLGPLGRGWQIDAAARTVALIGLAVDAPALFALAHAAVVRGVAVSVIIGAPDRDAAPVPFLLPAAAEYNVAHSFAAPSAALAQLDDALLRWADLLAVALPPEYWSNLVGRIRKARVVWNRGFAQAVVMPPLACCVGVCGVCGVETRHRQRLACVDGPIFDLYDLAR